MRSFRSLSDDVGMLGWLWLSAVVIAIDQLTKWMAEDALTLGEPMPIIAHLNMTLAHNLGASFGMLGDQNGWQRWFFAALAVLVCVFIVNWLRRLSKDRLWVAISLALVLGGAIGNLIDRLLYGMVTDFIDVYFDIPMVMANYHFATFNVADIAITCGATVLVIISLFASDQLE